MRLIVSDVLEKKIDPLLHPFGLQLVIANCEHQPLEHMPGSLHFSLVLRIVPTCFVPVCTETAIWVL